MAEAAAKVAGVRKVLRVEAAAYAQPVAEELAGADPGRWPTGYDYLLAASTTTGKNVMPRVAALLDTAQLSDIVAVVGPGHLPALRLCRQRAGDRARARDAKRVITVRTTAFAPAAAEGGTRRDRDRRGGRPGRPRRVPRPRDGALRPARPELGPRRGLGRARHRLGGEFQA